MEALEFQKYLETKDLHAEAIARAIDVINGFEKYLIEENKSLNSVTTEDLRAFAHCLIENDMNTWENYLHLLRYGYFAEKKPLIIATMEIIDGGEMIINLSKRLKKEFGQEIHAIIFKGIELPPLGIHPIENPKIMKQLIDGLIKEIGEKAIINFLRTGLRDKHFEEYRLPKSTWDELKNVDMFLDTNRKSFIETLETHNKEGTLFYTQEITNDVLEYVKADPSISSGIRVNDTVEITKIPYLTKEALLAPSSKEQQYYSCHHPWVREALLRDDEEKVNSVICHSCAGFYKNYWEAVFDHPIDVVLDQSIIKGGKACKFKFKIPSELLN